MTDDSWILYISKDVLVQDLSHVRRFQRICSLLCHNRRKRLRPHTTCICSLGAGSQIQCITFGNLMCFAGTDLIDDGLPVVFNDDKVLLRETEQDCLINMEIAFWPVSQMLIGHEEHGITFVPECTGIESLVMLLHIVDDVTDKSLLGTNAISAMDIRCDLQFNTCLWKIWFRFGIGRISEPTLLNDSTDSPLACSQATSSIDVTQRNTFDFLSLLQNCFFCCVRSTFHRYHSSQLSPY